MTPIVWVHEECLGAVDQMPHLAGLPAVFVFDREFLRRERYSLKRIAFLYESLLEFPVTLRHGNTAAEVLAFAALHQASSILSVAPTAPEWKHAAGLISAQLPIQWLSQPAFFSTNGPLDLRRFSRYWSKAQHSVFHPSRNSS